MKYVFIPITNVYFCSIIGHHWSVCLCLVRYFAPIQIQMLRWLLWSLQVRLSSLRYAASSSIWLDLLRIGHHVFAFPEIADRVPMLAEYCRARTILSRRGWPKWTCDMPRRVVLLHTRLHLLLCYFAHDSISLSRQRACKRMINHGWKVRPIPLVITWKNIGYPRLKWINLVEMNKAQLALYMVHSLQLSLNWIDLQLGENCNELDQSLWAYISSGII